MSVLPLDLTLTAGISLAALILGAYVWLRTPRRVGAFLFFILSGSLAIWTSADWLLHLESFFTAWGVVAWRAVFDVSVAFAPAVAVHVAERVGRRSTRYMKRWYGVALLVAIMVAGGVILRRVGYVTYAPSLLLAGGTVGLLMDAVAVIAIGLALYPSFWSSHASGLDRRRASYAAILLVLFLVAAAMQLVNGPIPVGFLMPLISLAFVLLSLLAFLRAGLLGIELGALEAFFVPLLTFAVVLLLRSPDADAFSVNALGLVVVGCFGAFAIVRVREERVNRERAEAEARELRHIENAKDDFLDMVAHQLRTPLTTVLGSTEMLLAGDLGSLPEAAGKSVSMIQNVGRRLLSLSETFLSAARLRVGTYESNPSMTDVRKEIQELEASLREMAASKGVQLSASLEHLPKTLVMDAEVLRNTVFNLLDNAIRYTPKGRVSLVAQFGDGMLTITVTDTGVGLTEHEQQALFRRFQRGRTSHELDGTGLGLYVVAELAHAVGGSVEATSQGPNLGASFTLRLPAHAASH